MYFSRWRRVIVQNERRKNTMRMRKYTQAVLMLLTAATIATGWLAEAAPLLGSERTKQTIAGSKGGAVYFRT
jgi:hypothetical protein